MIRYQFSAKYLHFIKIMDQEIWSLLSDIKARKSPAYLYEEELINLTLNRLLFRLCNKFPKYQSDVEDCLQEHSLNMLDLAKNFVMKYNFCNEVSSVIINHWLNLNCRIVSFDIIDRLRIASRKWEISIDQSLSQDGHYTLSDKLASRYSKQEDEIYLEELQQRFIEILAQPKFQKSLSRKYKHVTIADLIRYRLAQKTFTEISEILEIPFGTIASIWSRSIRKQLREELLDFAI